MQLAPRRLGLVHLPLTQLQVERGVGPAWEPPHPSTELCPVCSWQCPLLPRLPLTKVRSVSNFISRLTSSWKWLKDAVAAGRKLCSESVALSILE